MPDMILKEYQSDVNKHIYKHLSETFTQRETQNALAVYYIASYAGLPISDVKYLKKLNDELFKNRVLNLIVTTTIDDPHSTDLIYSAMGVNQYNYLMNEWKKSKQAFVFDRDMVSELAKTDVTFRIPHDIFDKLPYNTFYLDFSANEELCKRIDMDGILINVSGAEYLGHSYYLILGAIYKNGKNTFVRGNILLNSEEDEEITVEKLTGDVLNLKKGSKIDTTTQTVLITQALLYLSSYEPDIRETPDSKAKKASYKRNKKKNKKAEKPETTFVVGERFGSAFRKWTADNVGKSSETNSTGRHNKPHFRRAHWHRYWIGKKNSDERQLIVKWVHQCLCGTDDVNKVDFVKHKVKKEENKNGKNCD